MQKIIRKNIYFISLIINSDNEFLQKKFFDDIIFVLKQKSTDLNGGGKHCYFVHGR